MIGLTALALALTANADLVLNATGTTTYDFNSYAGDAAPTDWDVTAVIFGGTDVGSSTAGGVRAYEDTVGSLGFSLGALGTGTYPTFTFGLTIQNNTGLEITSLSLGFDVWQYRLANNGRESTITLNDVDSLGFNETVFTAGNTGTSGALQPPSAVGSAYSQSLSGLSIAHGSSITLEWIYDRGTGSGSAQGLAIDNVSITTGASAIPEPATLSLLGLGALAMVLRRKMKK